MNSRQTRPFLVCISFFVFENTHAHGDEQPETKVSARKTALVKALEGVDRLVIEPIPETAKRKDVTIRGEEKIKTLVRRIEIDDAKSGGFWMAEGGHRLHFFVGDRPVVTLRYIEGVALRWEDSKWQGDFALTGKSQEALPLWFKENNYPEFQISREGRLEREREQRAKTKRFIECFPANAQKLFDPLNGKPVSNESLAKVVGNPEDLTVAVCRALGTLSSTFALIGPV